MEVVEYSALKAALERQGARTKWPDQVKGRHNEKLRRALQKRVRSGRYKLENNKIYYKINFGATESPQHANGIF